MDFFLQFVVSKGYVLGYLQDVVFLVVWNCFLGGEIFTLMDLRLGVSVEFQIFEFIVGVVESGYVFIKKIFC